MTTKMNLFATWTKAISQFINQYIKDLKDEIIISDFHQYDDGFLVTVAKVDYYIFNESLAHELDMTVDDFKQYVSILEPYEVLNMLDEHFNHDEATEQYIENLRELVSLSVKCKILKEDHKRFVDEFASERKKLFSLYEVVQIDESCSHVDDKYSFVQSENGMTIDFAEFSASYVASDK